MLCCAPCSYPTFRLQDEEEKLRARQELVQGKLGDMLTMMSRRLVSIQHNSSVGSVC